MPATELLTANQQDLEAGTTTGWAAGTNSTIANSATIAYTGTRSLRLTASGVGDMQATITTGTGGTAVVPNKWYMASVHTTAQSSFRRHKLELLWYNSGGTLVATDTSTYEWGEGWAGASPPSPTNFDRGPYAVRSGLRRDPRSGGSEIVGGRLVQGISRVIDENRPSQIRNGGHSGWGYLVRGPFIAPDPTAAFLSLSVWFEGCAAAEQHYIDGNSVLDLGTYRGTKLEIDNILGFDPTNPLPDTAFIGLRGKDPTSALLGGGSDDQGSWGTI